MTTSFAGHLALRVAAEVKAQGRTQEQLAECLGTTQSVVSRKFRGRIAFQLDELPAVAEFLGMTVAQLVDGQAVGNSGQHPVSSAPTPSLQDGRAGKQRTAGPTRGQTSSTEQVPA